MAYFIIIRAEPVVQLGDKLRIFAGESFGTPDEEEVTKVEIKPKDGADYYDVTDASQRRWFLDWVYFEDGDEEISVRITTGEGMDEEVYEKDLALKVVSAADDLLFSSDDDLRSKEHDILNWLPDGYSSWNHIHRQAQKNIIDWMDELRILKSDGSRWLPSELVRRDQVRRLSMYIALRMIYGSISNQVGDVFDEKRALYAGLEKEAKNRNYLSLDDSSNEGQGTFKQELRSMSLVRR